MTQEDIIRMAREAGCHEASHPMNPWSVPQETLERFFRLAYESGAAAERAACADICDQHASIEGIAQRCAAEIRARGNK
jgi:hypothetical protein